MSKAPEDSRTFSDWVSAETHLKFMERNAQDDEIVICALAEHVFVYSVVVSNTNLLPIRKDDLMNWSSDPFGIYLASYTTGGGRDGVWIDREPSSHRTKTLRGSTHLIWGRTFEGWNGLGHTYYELHQEYAHLAGIHWRPEKRAYCRFDSHGDIEPVVSVTTPEDGGESETTLVSFEWKTLEEYLVASDTSLVRMFNFLLWRQPELLKWPKPEYHYDSDSLFYDQGVLPNYATRTRGVQIICPRHSKKTVFTRMKNRLFGRENREYAEFIAYDWRNNRVTEISTDPNATTNYFDAKDNSLPFELSPAFFKPRVLLKYKADRDKYTVGERDISCRATWYLKGYDVNEAGQVHVYICDLRDLPYEEQLHWLSHNEKPKTGISERAFSNDFKSEWIDVIEPLQKVLSAIRRWHSNKVAWWKLRDEKLFDRVNTPLTDSRDEWEEAFMDLAKLIVEGFEMKPIREKLNETEIPYKQEDKTIILLEKLLNRRDMSGRVQKLEGLRTVQSVRSGVKGHASGRKADQLVQNVLTKHETFGNHFQHVCTQVAEELEIIEGLFS